MTSPFDLYLDLKEKREETGRDLMPRFQIAIYRALCDHMSGKELLGPEIATELAFAMRDVIGGLDPPLFSSSRKRGYQRRTPTELDCIKDAVRYYFAVKSGVIKDSHPLKTIVDDFGGDDPMKGGLSPRTVQTWYSEPRFQNLESELYSPEKIRILLKISGQCYQKLYSRLARSESE